MKIAFLALMLSHAADAPAFKIGYVDMQNAMGAIEEGKREKAKMKKDFDAKQVKLDKLQEDLKKLKDDFDKQAPMLKEDARAKKQQELQTKYMELQQSYMAMQKELQDKEQQVTGDFFGKMKAIVEKIGDRDGYQLILERNAANVVYYKKHMDITDEVVRIYNTQYK